MYEFAYSEIYEDSPSQDVSQMRRLSDAIELIEAAQAASARSHEWHGVLSDFRRLWLMILEELPASSPEASGPYSHILRLADGVLQEIERRRFQKPQAFACAWRGMWPQ